MKWCIVGLGTLALLFGGVGNVTAGPLAGSGDPFILAFDENGHGSISISGGAFAPLPGILAVDPVSGGLALTYVLPAAAGLVNTGDVAVTAAGEPLGDMMRFTNGAGTLDGTTTGDRMIFYSDREPGEPPDLADVAQGYAVIFANGTVPEVGPEGNNGFDWLPGGNEYIGISDSPEPAAVTLLLIGVAGMAGYGWRKQKLAAA
jgi:hypothetical protein